MKSYPKRLIEVDLPIKRISEHARREKSIRRGHISTLHIWWARRPLAACRAVVCAGLWPDPADPLCPDSFRKLARALMKKWATEDIGLLSEESYKRFVYLQKNPDKFNDYNELRFALLDFIADFANWDNSNQKEYLETSRALTQAAHEALDGELGSRSMVVDPFAGGGSIPLEALRIGADAFASDLNPVAVLINKMVLEYIPKYGKQLAIAVRESGRWVKQQVEKEIADFYPCDSKDAIPISYLWARTVLSEAPSQDNIPVEIPLLRSLWLAKDKGRRKALRWVRDTKGQIQSKVESVTYADGISRKVRRPLLEIFEPQSEREVESGTSSGGSATCPISGFTVPVERVRVQLMQRAGGSRDARLVVVISKTPGIIGRVYRLPTITDLSPFSKIQSHLDRLIKENTEAPPLVPNEKLNHLRGFFNVVLYGMTTWGDLFSSRQLLSLITFIKSIKAFEISQQRKLPSDLQRAVQLCLAFALDKQADRNSTVCRWISQNENIGYTFGRQALPMVWDFVETSPLESSGAWDGIIEDIAETLEIQSAVNIPGQAEQSSATSHLLPDNTADYLFTDPPYYSAVPYADLSDFFYVWLKRIISNPYPELFHSPLSPKDEECVALSHRAAMYRNKDSHWFESMMRKACNESRRLTKQNGIGCFVFANKETRGWESMLAAIVESGWMVTGSWPIDTERPGRLRAQNSAALASSIHIICRPREYADKDAPYDNTGDWRQVLQELPTRIHEWMPRLAAEGIVGADAIFSCLGPALEIFSCYPRVEKASGEQVTLKEYLEQVWAAVAKEALNLIFEGADTTGFEEDARLTAMWLWTLSTGNNGNGKRKLAEDDEEVDEEEDSGKLKKITGGYALEYDAARKIAQGLGAHLEKLNTVVAVKGEIARLFPVSERIRFLFGKDETQSPSSKRKKKDPQLKLGFVKEIEEIERKDGWGAKSAPKAGSTVLDRLHQSMILFAAGRSEALKRFLVEEGAGNDQRFWRLAQALSALYPKSSDEKRWVDGVLARKKGLGF